MNFQQLDYVIAVDRLKHFAMAAESCNVTQATLSGMIIKLEEQLGYKLFDRSLKPIETTENGKIFIEKALEIIKIKDEIEDINNHDNQLKGTIVLGIIPTVASSLLPIIIPKIMDDHKNVTLEIKEITTEEIKKELQTGNIDLGILATPLMEDKFSEEILYYEKMLVYNSNESEKKYITSNVLKNKKVWLLEEGHCFGEQTKKVCQLKEKEVNKDRLIFNGGSFETLINMVDSFGGLTLLPELYLKGNQKNITPEKIITFKKPYPVREISIVSYKTLAKEKTINILSNIIKRNINPMLETSKTKNKDLEIIGV